MCDFSFLFIFIFMKIKQVEISRQVDYILMDGGMGGNDEWIVWIDSQRDGWINRQMHTYIDGYTQVGTTQFSCEITGYSKGTTSETHANKRHGI